MIVGTAGHIDHGKTALVRALTGVDTDRLKEEKARGISIDLGFAFLPISDGAPIGFIDVPGHERFIHNMLAGATGIDFALLVVAADDGVMPQTLEHLAILDLLGVTRGVIALTKADRVDEERLTQARAEIANVVSATSLSGADIVAVSAVTGQGVDKLRRLLLEAVKDFGQREARGRFRLAVDRSFTLAGIGTVVTGTVLSGRVAVGGNVLISPSGLRARVRTIHAQNRMVERSEAGDRCALNLVGESISNDAVTRGDFVIDPALHAPTDRIDAHLRVLASEPKPLPQWTPVRLHHAASEIGARVVLLCGDRLHPGADALIQLVLERPLAAAAGDRFIIRDTSARRTMGGGRFLDLRGPARKRRTPERIAQLQAQRHQDPAVVLAVLLDRSPHYVNLAEFGRDRALTQHELDAIALRIGVVQIAYGKETIAALPATWNRLKERATQALHQFHEAHVRLPGMEFERLRRKLWPSLPAIAFTAAMHRLSEEGAIAIDGARVRLKSHKATLSQREEDLWRRIAPLLGGRERFRPPRVRDIANFLAASEAEVRNLMKHFAGIGQLHEIANDHFFLPETIDEIVHIAGDLASSSDAGEFALAQFRDRLDNGRKVAMQILEFFDRQGFTSRRGDRRKINPHRIRSFSGAIGIQAR